MTKNYKLLNAVFRGMWWMEQSVADSYLPLIMAMMEGKPVMEENPDAPALPLAVTVDAALIAKTGGGATYFDSLDDAPEGSVSLTHFSGAIMKYDQLCSYGTQTLNRQMKAADAHPNISAHILIVDSGGGSVDGTKDSADTIKSLTKPVIAFVDGMAASAAYWIASASDEIILSNDTSQVGSIGTMISFVDARKRMEEMGYTFHDIRAEDSYDKNETFYQALKKDYKLMQSEVLNPLNKIFQNAVRANRPGVNEKALHGKMYFGQDAIANQLADSIGNFEYALSRANALAQDQPGAKAPQKEQTDMFNKFPKLLAAAKAETISAEQLNEINAELMAAGITGLIVAASDVLDSKDTEIASMQQSLTDAVTARATAEQALAAAQAERDQYKELADSYGAQPAVLHTNPVKVKGDSLTKDTITGQELIDSLAHNRELDSNPMFNNSQTEE